MDARSLAHGGLSLSVIGLGCNNFGGRLDAAASAAVVHAALDAGVTHFDTAEMYGGGLSEEYLGAALGSRRDEVVIATKFLPRPKDVPYAPGALAARIREAAELSLRRLGTDHIDLYYQHYPDADAPADEALEVLDELVRAGKVLHLANSNFSAEQIATAASVSATKGWAAFAATQIEWSLVSRAVEESVVPAATATGLGVVPYFPLASGMLTGKYRQGEAAPAGTRMEAWGPQFATRFATEANFHAVGALQAVADAHGCSLIELALGWLLAQPNVTSVLTGATTPEQIHANVAAAGVTLGADAVAAASAA
jgi:aryl-alcohol dehydrogenase-like predicted oxidoreductase